MTIFIIGYPSDIGGANTELWHTVKLWRRFGLDVALIPTWQADVAWRRRLETIGCRTIECNPDALEDVPDLAGSTVVAMCNTKFLAVAGRFRRLRCRVVWLGCMNWLFPEERLHYRQFGPFARHVFQSRFQHDQLVPQLRRYGYLDRQGRIIRGALDAEEIPFQPLPHAQEEVFVVGRISRADPDKFSPTLWNTYRRIPHPIRARVLGWESDVQARLGPPPPWAECLPPGAQAVAPFLNTLHALAPGRAAAVENWPRVGLEAMAAGVPLVVEAKGGWLEMVRHGETGYLCKTEDQIAYYGARLAYDEPHRLQLARQARRLLVSELADPRAIWLQWRELFKELEEKRD
jgi:hypothetical protein